MSAYGTTSVDRPHAGGESSKGQSTGFEGHVPASGGSASRPGADSMAESKSARQHFFGGDDAEAASPEATVSKLINLALQQLKEGRPEFAKSLIRAALAVVGSSPDDFDDTGVEKLLEKALKKDDPEDARQPLEKAGNQLQQKAECAQKQPTGVRDAEPVGLAEDALRYVLSEVLGDETVSEDNESLQHLLSILKLALDSLQEAYSPYADNPGPVGDHARKALEAIDRFFDQLEDTEPDRDQIGDLIREIAERFGLNLDGSEALEDTSAGPESSDVSAAATRDSDIIESVSDLIQTAIDAINDSIWNPQSSDAEAVLDLVIGALLSLWQAYGEAHDSPNSEEARKDIQGFLDRALDIGSLGEPKVILTQLLGLISDIVERFDLAPEEKEEA